MKTEEIIPLVIQWAKDKNLNDPKKQTLKCYEELGELAKAILENDRDEIIDAIGDSFITIIILASQRRLEKQLYVDLNESLFTGCSTDSYSLAWIYSDIYNEEFYYCISHLSDIAKNHKLTLIQCLNAAWNTIKNRKGKTVNGTFIKKK